MTWTELIHYIPQLYAMLPKQGVWEDKDIIDAGETCLKYLLPYWDMEYSDAVTWTSGETTECWTYRTPSFLDRQIIKSNKNRTEALRQFLESVIKYE